MRKCSHFYCLPKVVFVLFNSWNSYKHITHKQSWHGGGKAVTAQWVFSCSIATAWVLFRLPWRKPACSLKFVLLYRDGVITSSRGRMEWMDVRSCCWTDGFGAVIFPFYRCKEAILHHPGTLDPAWPGLPTDLFDRLFPLGTRGWASARFACLGTEASSFLLLSM